jgi:hypothetical protein
LIAAGVKSVLLHLNAALTTCHGVAIAGAQQLTGPPGSVIAATCFGPGSLQGIF